MRLRSFVWAVLVLGVALTGLGAPATLLADGESYGIIVTPPRVKAGGAINVQGTALWTELPVNAQLVGRGGATRSLGSGMTGPDGSLNLAVSIPPDVPAGQYTVVVMNEYGESAQAPLVVEDEVPVVPIAVLGGAAIVALLVVVAGARRRGWSSPSGAARVATAEPESEGPGPNE